jgi:precorrin-4/cobalt-precorrin-4 C11-methyltransferase
VRASWPDERRFRATLATIAQKIPDDVERTAMILVGPALGTQEFADSALYDPAYVRRFRTP